MYWLTGVVVRVTSWGGEGSDDRTADAGNAGVCDAGAMTGRASLGVGRSVMVSVKSAPIVTALSKYAPLTFAPCRFAPVKVAWEKLQRVRSASLRFAPFRFARKKFASLSVAFLRSASARFQLANVRSPLAYAVSNSLADRGW